MTVSDPTIATAELVVVEGIEVPELSDLERLQDCEAWGMRLAEYLKKPFGDRVELFMEVAEVIEPITWPEDATKAAIFGFDLAVVEPLTLGFQPIEAKIKHLASQHGGLVPFTFLKPDGLATYADNSRVIL